MRALWIIMEIRETTPKSCRDGDLNSRCMFPIYTWIIFFHLLLGKRKHLDEKYTDVYVEEEYSMVR